MRKRSGNEQQVPDWVEERDRALNRSRGHGLALGGGELVTQLGHVLLELVITLVEFGQPLGGHVAPGFVATDGLQHTLALLAAALLPGGELRELLLKRRSALGVALLQDLETRVSITGSAAIERIGASPLLHDSRIALSLHPFSRRTLPIRRSLCHASNRRRRDILDSVN